MSPSKAVVVQREPFFFAPALHNSTVLLRVDFGNHAPKDHHVSLERLTLLTFAGWEELVFVVEVVLGLEPIVDTFALPVAVALVKVRWFLSYRMIKS